jgi:DNA (cytosine-5)-methyltransferase 1
MSRPPALHIHADELVVDNFAGGGGASLGIEWALGRSPDIAVNHDPEAVAMHAANHPGTKHFCEDVWKVDPKAACRGRKVALAWFSPDCKHFSKAKGGKPVEKKIRGLAWVVIRWAKAVKPRVIILENVEEFQDWGPLLDDGRPCPLRRGLTFRRWLGGLRNCGYEVETRELRACDYGAPTTRKRLFVIARSDGLRIVWPEPTHGAGRVPWRTAAECIEWCLPCPSIFERQRPLAENTLRRIARGLKRYVFDAAEPFIIPLTHHWNGGEYSIGEPMRTVTGAHRGEHALVTPYFAGVGGRKGQSPETPVDRPYHTITAKGDTAIVAPTLVQTGYGEREGQAPRSLDLHKPLGTVVGGGQKHALVSAFLARHYGGHENDGSAAQLPMFTVTTKDHHALVASHLLRFRGGLADHDVTAQDLRAPAPTLTARGWHLAEVRAFLIKYYSADQDPQLGLPLHTITTKHRFGLVTVHGEDYAVADIGMRMLVPRELFRAQGFPDTYRIELQVAGKPLSKGAQVRMCGNSVVPPLAAALVRANFAAQAKEAAA